MPHSLRICTECLHRGSGAAELGYTLMQPFSHEFAFVAQDPEGESALPSQHDGAGKHCEDGDSSRNKRESERKENYLLGPHGNEHGSDQRHKGDRSKT